MKNSLADCEALTHRIPGTYRHVSHKTATSGSSMSDLELGNPLGDKSSVLSCCGAPTRSTSASEQQFTWFLAGGLYVFFDCLTGARAAMRLEASPIG
jgi:hypothetical protein